MPMLGAARPCKMNLNLPVLNDLVEYDVNTNRCHHHLMRLVAI